MDPIDSISICSTHIAFSSKTPYPNDALHTRTDVHLLPLQSGSLASQPSNLTPGTHGAISAVTFSSDKKKLAWLEMAQDGYESDKRVLVVRDMERKSTIRWTEDWDRSPISISVRSEDKCYADIAVGIGF